MSTDPTTRAVLELPSLDGTTLGLRHHAGLWTVSPGDAVNLPLAVLALELERLIKTLLVRRERNIAELARQLAVVVITRNGVSNNKAHDLVCVEVSVDISDLSVRLEGDVLVLVLGEVNNDFPALCH